jgi:CBS domain-containing protein
MTAHPISIRPDTPLPEARALMKEFGIRRLPVVNAGRLVGILTSGDIREASASDATTLSVYELNYLLERIPASEVMTPDPHTISADATIGEAARLMYEHKIGGLPVSAGEALLGIITESDFCRLLMLQPEPLEA